SRPPRRRLTCSARRYHREPPSRSPARRRSSERKLDRCKPSAARPDPAFTLSGPSEPTAASRFSDALALAVDLAHEAGRLLMDRYERVERVDYKGARDVVTEVDRLSEGLI